MKKRKYKIIKECFIGKIGDLIEVNWDTYDGASWENLTQNTAGNPFVENDCLEEIE